MRFFCLLLLASLVLSSPAEAVELRAAEET